MTFQHPRVRQEVWEEFTNRKFNKNGEKALVMTKDVIDYTKEELEAIEWMNERYYCTMLENNGWPYFRVIFEEHGRTTILTQARFIKSLVGMRVLATDQFGKTKLIPISKFWLGSPLRRMIPYSEMRISAA
jgi:hypothetical protein